MTQEKPTRLLDQRQLLQIKLFQLLSLRLYMDADQLAEFGSMLGSAQGLKSEEIPGVIEKQIEPLIRRLKEQKRAFLRNDFS